MLKDTHIHFRTSEEMREKIKKLAAEENRSVANYIEMLVIADEEKKAKV